MVKKVLAWRASSTQEADGIWSALQIGNENLAAELTRLAEGQTSTEEDYHALREIILKNRQLIRQMGEKSGVPIEPPQQTKLLDFCSKIKGVVGGVVPGAGGFDAIVLLVEDKEEVMTSLNTALEQYQDKAAMEGMQIGKVGVIGVREEMVGVRMEELSLYSDWEISS